MDDRTAQVVQDQFRRTGRSLLQYVGDSSPWTAAEDGADLGKLRQLIAEEKETLADLAGLLRRHRVPTPYLGPYPEPFMTLNYLSLDRLLPLLLTHQRAAVAELDATIARCSDGEAHAALLRLLERKRRHLAELEALNQTHTQVGSRV